MGGLVGGWGKSRLKTISAQLKLKLALSLALRKLFMCIDIPENKISRKYPNVIE